MKFKFLFPVYTIFCTLFLLSIAIEAKNDGSNGMVSWQKQTVMATVVKVIPDSGIIALEGPNGRIWTLAVDKKVDLKKYKKGDNVRVTLYQGEALDIREP
ncbi:MAG: hypothetical protein GX640_15185, partial [Fibrobacter sp.]|nr:hypothetical protein [Fibrobacter sp.]